VKKYDGTRRNAKRKSSYERTTDSQVSPTDPAATPMCRFPSDHAQLGYHLHYVVDGGKARIILAALVTPASVMDNLPISVPFFENIWIAYEAMHRPRSFREPCASGRSGSNRCSAKRSNGTKGLAFVYAAYTK
jgi:hypothetical protein